MHKDDRGFTLMEMLIVVAIIAVLIAIAIPIMTAQLEKSREATDAANIRAQYAEVMAEVITRGTDINTDGTDLDKVSLVQAIDDWQNSQLATNLASIATIDGTPKAGGTAWVSCENGAATIHFDGGAAGGSSGSDQPSSTAYDGNPINIPKHFTLKEGENRLKITLPASINEPIEATLFIHHGNSENGTSVTITLNPNNTSSLYTVTDDLSGNNHRVRITFNSDSLTQEQAQAIASSIEVQ